MVFWCDPERLTNSVVVAPITSPRIILSKRTLHSSRLFFLSLLSLCAQAQDVQKVLPEAIELFQHDKEEVKNGALAGDLLNIQYQKLTALLIEGIKEQQEQIEFLQERVTILEKDIRE